MKTFFKSVLFPVLFIFTSITQTYAEPSWKTFNTLEQVVPNLYQVLGSSQTLLL